MSNGVGLRLSEFPVVPAMSVKGQRGKGGEVSLKYRQVQLLHKEGEKK
jgi:hypothetical protein